MKKIELEAKVKLLEEQNDKLKMTILLMQELMNAGGTMKNPTRLVNTKASRPKRPDSGLTVDPKVKSMVDEVLTEIEENIKDMNK
jgi:hypothetical protein